MLASSTLHTCKLIQLIKQLTSTQFSPPPPEKSTYHGLGKADYSTYARLSGLSKRYPYYYYDQDDDNDRARREVKHGHSTGPSTSTQPLISSMRAKSLKVKPHHAEPQYTQPSSSSSRKPQTRFHDPIGGQCSTGTDSGTRSSLSAGGRFPPSARRHTNVSSLDRPPRLESIRSLSQERQYYSYSPRDFHRHQP